MKPKQLHHQKAPPQDGCLPAQSSVSGSPQPQPTYMHAREHLQPERDGGGVGGVLRFLLRVPRCPVLGCSLQRSTCRDGYSDVSVTIAGSCLHRVSHLVYFNEDILQGQTKAYKQGCLLCWGRG